MSSFVHLHLHTEYSLLDGLIKIKKLIPTIKEMGMSSCAITDHGNMYGAIEFYKTCLKNEIKPIIGAELYLSPKSIDIKTNDNRSNYHLILLSKNDIGYHNLMKMISIAHVDGYYYKPRIDWNILRKYHQGLICLSACIEGQIGKLILNNQPDIAQKKAQDYLDLFKDDYYLEIQKHQNLKEQDIVNQQIIKISRKLGIPLVATNDAHYLTKDDAFAQDVLLMINTKTTLDTKNRLSMLSTPDFYVKSPKTLSNDFKEYPDALKNTIKIADKCNLNIDIGNWYFPKFKIAKNETAESQLKKMVDKKAKEYYQTITPEIQQRLDHELDVICPKGYAPYFLIMEDFISWTEKNDTATNTRGSAGGSLVSFVLGITSVDPLVYQLPFERFLNKDRPSPPDIDLDVSDDKRQGMLHHIIDEYGKENVAQVCTFGRMNARGAIRDTTRVLAYEYAIGDKISKLIPLGSQGFPMSIKKALEITPELKSLYDNDPDSKKIIEAAKQIEGNARHISVHACAIVISPDTITKYSPIQIESGGEKTITQYEMHAIEDVGLLKFDILGIVNLSILGHAVINVRKTKKINIDLKKIPLDDKKTFDMLSKGDTMGVFQLSGGGMTKWLKELKPQRIEDIMAMVALYRPGPMAMIPEYIARKNDSQKISFFDPKMEKWLEKSYGLLVYQDDCLYTAIELAGYNWIEVDKFRKAIGKKIPEEMAAQKQKFIQGCIKNGYTQKKAEEIFGYIEPFTSYGFNKAHAASYGMLAYRTAYMKANFSVEYMCALLTAEANDIEKVSTGVEECRKMRIIVSPPDINKSHNDFEIENNKESLSASAIRFGLNAIKNVGNKAIENILNERNSNGQFNSFTEFCLRVDNQKVNKKVLESLIKVGALDQFGKRSAMLAAIDEIRQKTNTISAKKNTGQNSLFDTDDEEKTKVKIITDNLPDIEEFTEKEKLRLEKELIGIYISENPIQKLLTSFKDIAIPKISEIKKRPQNSTVKFVAVIEKIKNIRTKKSNAKMAFLTLVDQTDKIETVIFPKVFETSESILIENHPVYVEGKINIRNENTSVIVDLISDKASLSVPKFDFIIEIPKGTSQSKLMELNRLLKSHPNGHKGLIILDNGKEIPLSYGVVYNSSLKQQIDKILKLNID